MDLKVEAKQERPSDKPMRIVITLPTNAYFISGIRDFTLGLITNTTKFSEQWAFRFQSVVDELCNNAIEYGSAPSSDIRITFTVDSKKYLQIEVEDTGTGRKGMNAKQLADMVEERKQPDFIVKGIRGRGLSKIVAGWTDELRFTDRPDGGMKVIIRKYLDKPEEVTENSVKNPGAITIHAIH